MGLILQLKYNFYAECDEYLGISALLEFLSDFVSAGQFKVTSSGMQNLMHVIDVDAVELVFQLDSMHMERVIHACGVLYVMAMNGLENILTGRQSSRGELTYAAPPCLLMDIIKTSAVDFVKLATNHKH